MVSTIRDSAKSKRLGRKLNRNKTSWTLRSAANRMVTRSRTRANNAINNQDSVLRRTIPVPYGDTILKIDWRTLESGQDEPSSDTPLNTTPSEGLEADKAEAFLGSVNTIFDDGRGLVLQCGSDQEQWPEKLQHMLVAARHAGIEWDDIADELKTNAHSCHEMYNSINSLHTMATDCHWTLRETGDLLRIHRTEEEEEYRKVITEQLPGRPVEACERRLYWLGVNAKLYSITEADRRWSQQEIRHLLTVHEAALGEHETENEHWEAVALQLAQKTPGACKRRIYWLSLKSLLDKRHMLIAGLSVGLGLSQTAFTMGLTLPESRRIRLAAAPTMTINIDFQWTLQETEDLLRMHRERTDYSDEHWRSIAEKLPGRAAGACERRVYWFNLYATFYPNWTLQTTEDLLRMYREDGASGLGRSQATTPAAEQRIIELTQLETILSDKEDGPLAILKSNEAREAIAKRLQHKSQPFRGGKSQTNQRSAQQTDLVHISSVPSKVAIMEDDYQVNELTFHLSCGATSSNSRSNLCTTLVDEHLRWPYEQQHMLVAAREAGIEWNDIANMLLQGLDSCQRVYSAMRSHLSMEMECDWAFLDTSILLRVHRENTASGDRLWKSVAEKLPGRSAAACERRIYWLGMQARLYSIMKARTWTDKETTTLLSTHETNLYVYNTEDEHWKSVARGMSRKSPDACKHRVYWLSLKSLVNEEHMLVAGLNAGLSYTDVGVQMGHSTDWCKKQFVAHRYLSGIDSFWTLQETEDLLRIHREDRSYGDRHWDGIAKNLPGRPAEACERRIYWLEIYAKLYQTWTLQKTEDLVRTYRDHSLIPKTAPARILELGIMAETDEERREQLRDALCAIRGGDANSWENDDDVKLVNLIVGPSKVVWETVSQTLRRSIGSCKNRWSSLKRKAHELFSQDLDSLPNSFSHLKRILEERACYGCKILLNDRRVCAEHRLFCGDGVLSLDCVVCGMNLPSPHQLIDHYSEEHRYNVREIGVMGIWARENPHLLPHFDFNNGYGLFLTRRSVVSGGHVDSDIRQLWSTLTNLPATLSLRRGELLTKYRSEFEALFKTTPARFHAHVSDITPSSVLSLVYRLLASAGISRKELPSHKAPNFCCTPGTYGAAYGPGANKSIVADVSQTAAGEAYVKVETAGRSAQSIEAQLRTAKDKGCFAFLTEIMRWSDGRIMPITEWKHIHDACEEVGMFLIVDETLSLIRCGAPFAYQSEQYNGSPDLVLFGKGLVTAGVALDWNGPWLSRLGLQEERKRATLHEIDDSLSNALEISVLIQSLGIIRMASKENWVMRAAQFGITLRAFARETFGSPMLEEANIRGLGSLLYLKTLDVAHHAVQGAAAGGRQVRWIPSVDDATLSLTGLREKFGPLSVKYRRKLGAKLMEASSRPLACASCGKCCYDDTAEFCGDCCATSCGECQGSARLRHRCIDGVKDG